MYERGHNPKYFGELHGIVIWEMNAIKILNKSQEKMKLEGK